MTTSFEDKLRDSLESACQAQNVSVIIRGRNEILAMPRDAVLQCIERVVADCLTLDDEWEYRRLLELYELLDHELVQRLIDVGLRNTNEEVREAAEDFGANC